MHGQDKFVRFPTPFGAEDYENRGVNDREILFFKYCEKVREMHNESSELTAVRTGESL